MIHDYSEGIPYLSISCLILPYLTRCNQILPYLSISYHILPDVTRSYHISSYLTISYLILPYLTRCNQILPYLSISYHIFPYLISSYHILLYLSRSSHIWPCISYPIHKQRRNRPYRHEIRIRMLFDPSLELALHSDWSAASGDKTKNFAPLQFKKIGTFCLYTCMNGWFSMAP